MEILNRVIASAGGNDVARLREALVTGLARQKNRRDRHSYLNGFLHSRMRMDDAEPVLDAARTVAAQSKASSTAEQTKLI